MLKSQTRLTREGQPVRKIFDGVKASEQAQYDASRKRVAIRIRDAVRRVQRNMRDGRPARDEDVTMLSFEIQQKLNDTILSFTVDDREVGAEGFSITSETKRHLEKARVMLESIGLNCSDPWLVYGAARKGNWKTVEREFLRDKNTILAAHLKMIEMGDPKLAKALEKKFAGRIHFTPKKD